MKTRMLITAAAMLAGFGLAPGLLLDAGAASYTTANSYTFEAAPDNLISGKAPLSVVNGDGGTPAKLTDATFVASTAEVYRFYVTTQVPARCGRAPEGIDPSQSLQHGV